MLWVGDFSKKKKKNCHLRHFALVTRFCGNRSRKIHYRSSCAWQRFSGKTWTRKKNALTASPQCHFVKHVLLCYYNIQLEKAMSFTLISIKYLDALSYWISGGPSRHNTTYQKVSSAKSVNECCRNFINARHTKKKETNGNKIKKIKAKLYII